MPADPIHPDDDQDQDDPVELLASTFAAAAAPLAPLRQEMEQRHRQHADANHAAVLDAHRRALAAAKALQNAVAQLPNPTEQDIAAIADVYRRLREAAWRLGCADI